MRPRASKRIADTPPIAWTSVFDDEDPAAVRHLERGRAVRGRREHVRGAGDRLPGARDHPRA